MEVDGKQDVKQLVEALAEAEADIKFHQKGLKRNPHAPGRAEKLEASKAVAATIRQQQWDAKDPMLQLRGKSQKIGRKRRPYVQTQAGLADDGGGRGPGGRDPRKTGEKPGGDRASLGRDQEPSDR